MKLPSSQRTLIVQPLPGIGDMIWHLPHIHAIAATSIEGQVDLLTKPRSQADRLLAAPILACGACCGWSVNAAMLGCAGCFSVITGWRIFFSWTDDPMTTLFTAEAKLGICCRLDQALTEFKRSISVIGCCGDSWKP